MLPHRLPPYLRQVHAVIASITVAALGVSGGIGQAAASTATTPGGTAPALSVFGAGTKVVSYLGYNFEVPRSWPVYNDTLHPHTCVRFDMHAVYLGTPGVNQNCPSWLLGATEAVVIEPDKSPVHARAAEDPVSRQILVTAPRIRITATFDTDPTVIYKMLASASLPAPVIRPPNPARLAVAAGKDASARGTQPLAIVAGRDRADALSRARRVAAPALPAAIANDHGLGFDSCAAPSTSYMRTWWRKSPYGAIGIYIGGADRACDQRNLTAGWVRRQAATGWRFFPMYAGLQASFGQLTSPARQGAKAAADAVEDAERLGFGPRTPIYYDMEAYPPKDARRALRFLSAWTKGLHRLGYKSGVYGSSGSGIADLARQYKRGSFAMPDVIYYALWNGARNISDRVYKKGEWTHARRLHQFSGDVVQSYDGDTIEIDQDYLDLALTSPGGTTQATATATGTGQSVEVFYQGSDHKLREDSARRRGGWARTNLGGDLTSAPSVVEVGSYDLDVFYRGRGGFLWQRRRTRLGWQRPRELPMMGVLGGAPRAVAQPNGVIDVFWHGSADRHLWHGQYSPGNGWTGPQGLGGSLESAPSPVETRSGTVQVFWQGTDGRLRRVVRKVGRSWTQPASLGIGQLGGAARAVALPGGEIDVFWRGATRPHAVWEAVIKRGGKISGPQRLGGRISGSPVPVAAASMERVFYRGQDGRLWELVRSHGRWGPPIGLTRMGRLRSAPFAASGSGSGPLEVFWSGSRGRLWSARLTDQAGWQRPVDLGGLVHRPAA